MTAYAYETDERLVQMLTNSKHPTGSPGLIEELKRRGLPLDKCKELYPEYFL